LRSAEARRCLIVTKCLREAVPFDPYPYLRRSPE
jgi:hypothetical protein